MHPPVDRGSFPFSPLASLPSSVNFFDYQCAVGPSGFHSSELLSMHFPFSSRDTLDDVDVSRAMMVVLMHGKECNLIENDTQRNLILIPESIQPYSTVDLQLETGGSCQNVISLANWNNYVVEADDAFSSPLVSNSGNRLEFSLSIPLSAKHKRCCRSNKYEIMYSIMGVGASTQAECSIHDSDIDNKNGLFFEEAAQVLNDCQDLNVALLDQEDEVISSVVHILKKH